MEYLLLASGVDEGGREAHEATLALSAAVSLARRSAAWPHSRAEGRTALLGDVELRDELQRGNLWRGRQ